MRRFHAVLAIALFIGGCSAPSGPPPGEEDHLRQALVDLVADKASGDRIRLADAWSGEWDRAAVLGPYSSDSQAGEVLGFDFAIETASPWTNSEGGWVVVLAKGGEAIAWFKVPAADVGLYCLPELVERGADEFTVHHDDQGFVGIGPEDGADRCI